MTAFIIWTGCTSALEWYCKKIGYELPFDDGTTVDIVVVIVSSGLMTALIMWQSTMKKYVQWSTVFFNLTLKKFLFPCYCLQDKWITIIWLTPLVSYITFLLCWIFVLSSTQANGLINAHILCHGFPEVDSFNFKFSGISSLQMFVTHT